MYTATGQASFGLPAGTYTVYAGRGFEYGVDSLKIVLNPGDSLHKKLVISREVPTPGWISSDTHIHTFTYSRHGDASLEERAITIAAEGIELPILTDHNLHVSIDSVAKQIGVRGYFTPVVGNEVTTKVGHFNVFPLKAESPVINHQVDNWQALSNNIFSKEHDNNQLNRQLPGKVVILNHGRDVHQHFRPLGEDHHLALTGKNLDNWVLLANAMEVVNSGSQQNDPIRLFLDWFGLLNRGYPVTPVGSSDSHDVSRYLVGQARTYIEAEDSDPGRIDVSKAVDNFLAGKVMVSFGLMPQLTVNNTYGPGEIAPFSKRVKVQVNVLGPAWVRASHISLYANGEKISEKAIHETTKAGVKWQGEWLLPVGKQDFYLVAIVEGPANHAPFWPIAKPYQPTSAVWQPGVIGCSGAVWIDADRDGKRTSAYTYAKTLVTACKGDMVKLFSALNGYDEAVAVQTASLLQEQGHELTDAAIAEALAKAPKIVKRGFEKFAQAWQVSQTARPYRQPGK